MAASRRRNSAPSRAATIREVASRAGVSVATVSRVLNRTGPVREATAARVFEAVRKLRYLPHGGARSLSTSRTQTIGVVLPDLYGEFFSEVIRGIDLAARMKGYHIIVSGSHSERAGMAAVLMAVRGRVDGLIIMSPDQEAASLHAEVPAGVPVVLLSRAAAGALSITIDNYGGATAMVRHLASLGHKRIAFLRGPDDNTDARERLRGYRDAVARLRLVADARLELPGDFREESGFAGVARALALRPRPTAIFAANDSMAIGALAALHGAGVAVPAEMAVAGFDDIPIARYVSPPLTTVNVAIAELGRRAFALLFAVLENGSTRRRHEVLGTRLVVRQSCGANVPGDQNRRARRRASIVTANT